MSLGAVSQIFARATWSEGHCVRYSTDRLAMKLGLLGFVSWTAMAVLAWIGPYSVMLLLLGVCLLIRSLANWRLRSVAARLEATASAEEVAAAKATPPLMGRYCAWAAGYYDRKAERLAERADKADADGDEFKAWDLRRRAGHKQERADQARDLIDHWQ